MFFIIWSNKFHLLCTFQRRLPSLSTLDEWLAIVSGDATICSNSKVARLLSNRWPWSRWYQKLIKMWVKWYCPSSLFIYSLAPPLSDFYCLFSKTVFRSQTRLVLCFIYLHCQRVYPFTLSKSLSIYTVKEITLSRYIFQTISWCKCWLPNWTVWIPGNW